MADRAGRVVTVPNVLTVLRLVLIPFFVLASLERNFVLAFGFFLAAAVTDALDGWIARRFNLRSKIGAVLDPAADKLMLVFGYLVYTLPSVATYRLSVWLTFTVFVRDVLIVLAAYLLYTRISIRRFPPSPAGKISTITQVVALAATIGANTPIAPVALPVMYLAHPAALLMTIYSGWDYLRRWDARVRELETENAR